MEKARPRLISLSLSFHDGVLFSAPLKRGRFRDAALRSPRINAGGRESFRAFAKEKSRGFLLWAFEIVDATHCCGVEIWLVCIVG